MTARPPGKVVEIPKQIREGMDANHLRNIRLCPCLICGARPAGNAHHLLTTSAAKERGMGRREADMWAVPLCTAHHDQQSPYGLHREGAGDEPAWFARYGIDGAEAARALWRCRGLPEKMIGTVMKLRNAARLRLRAREGFGL